MIAGVSERLGRKLCISCLQLLKTHDIGAIPREVFEQVVDAQVDAIDDTIALTSMMQGPGSLLGSDRQDLASVMGLRSRCTRDPVTLVPRVA